MNDKNSLWLAVVVAVACGCVNTSRNDEAAVSKKKPNIIYILADDLGYGDVSCYAPEGKVKTPNIDKLAAQGMRFTDAHSPSSVCTPTRYSILTGQYPWRSRLSQGVLRGYGRALIPANRPTVASVLQERGYHTAVIGKWHLGLDWAIRAGHENVLRAGNYGVRPNGVVTDTEPEHIDFNLPPANGPLTRGFDYSFILPASLDMDPYCYLENDTLTEIPSGHTPGNDLNTGYTGAFWRAGKIAPAFAFDQVLVTFTKKAIDYLHQRAPINEPFFLYLPLTGPHTPWVPTPEFKGTSSVGAYGDFVQMVDDAVGKVVRALDSLGIAEGTLVVFASDNGPFWRPASVEQFGHRAAGNWRGMKADVWEGGHRVPFVVRWPGMVRAGTICSAPTTLSNLMATCAEIIDIAPVAAAQDSYSILPLLRQEADTVPGQPAIVHHSSMGHFAIRQGKWKLIEKHGSGGFSEPSEYLPGPEEPAGQLYDLAADPGETTNLYARFPGKVTELQKLLDDIRTAK